MKKNLKLFVATLLFCLCSITIFAQQKPTATYTSKKVYFSKPGTQKGSSEPYAEVANGDGLYLFTIYNGHIVIKKNETNDLKIVSLKQHKGETKYNLVDAKGRHFEMYLTVVDKSSNANITFTEFDNSYAPLGTYMITCEKQ